MRLRHHSPGLIDEDSLVPFNTYHFANSLCPSHPGSGRNWKDPNCTRWPELLRPHVLRLFPAR